MLYQSTSDTRLLSFMFRKEAVLLDQLGMKQEARSLKKRARLLEVQVEADLVVEDLLPNCA